MEMLGLPIKSALFIDYENVGKLCPADSIERWAAWLEDGRFDKGRKRRLLHKRVYWNPSALKHEEVFTKAGFSTVLCEKFSMLKNGADITITIDATDMIRDHPKVAEFILFTTDTDFVPVLKKLRLEGRQTAVLVNEEQAQVYGTYRRHADI